jgi:small subunit ribosomal protein S20
MPIKQNAKKALRQNIKRAVVNKVYKDKFREMIKTVGKTKTLEEAKKLAIIAQKALDKAAKHGTIKKNTAARKLSRLMKKVNALAKK